MAVPVGMFMPVPVFVCATHGAGRAAGRLRARLGPFVLRRTKREVVRELPDKIEQTILCDLSAPQKEVYKRLLEEGLAEIREARRRGAGAGRRATAGS